MAVVIRSRRGPGTTPSTTQGAEVKSNPEVCGPQNPQNPQGVPMTFTASGCNGSLNAHRIALRRSHQGAPVVRCS